MKAIWTVKLAIIALLALPSYARASEPEEFFRVISSALNVESDQAELCLVLSHPVDVSGRSAIANVIRLEKDGKRVHVSSRDLSLTPTDLCIQQLEHRSRYRLTIRNLRSREGELLGEPVSMAFVVPDRKPFLRIADDDVTQGFSRYDPSDDKKKTPQILALNVMAAQLTLYKFHDRKNLAEAARQAGQIHLAPSESLYFARQNGETIWQSELIFGDKPNVEQKLEAPFPSGQTLKPGLYFLSVTPSGKGDAPPDLVAGHWFFVSGLRLSAINSPDGIYGFVTHASEPRVLPDIDILMLSQDGRVLGGARTDAEGAALLPNASDKGGAYAVVAAVSDAGDMDVADLLQKAPKSYFLPPRMTEIEIDREEYRGGDSAVVTLSARDVQGKFLDIKDSALKLLRPDFSLANEQPIPSGKAGFVALRVPVPASSKAGRWHLLWQHDDGTVFGEKTFFVKPDKVWPKVSIEAESDQVDADGWFALTIRAVDENNRPLAWSSGVVDAYLSRPEFAGQKKYVFGIPFDEHAKPILQTRFLTSKDGVAHVRMHVPVSEGLRNARAIKVVAHIDRSTEPAHLTLPIASPKGWLGIRPVLGGSLSHERNQAAFEIIALDSAGERHAAEDIYYQIYEEGRSFEWYQAEGHWGYRRRPHHRRVGGGRLSGSSSGEFSLRFPVTLGQYMLELSSADGLVMAQYAFQAGRKKGNASSSSGQSLVLKAPLEPFEAGKEGKIILVADRKAVASVLIGDERVRKTYHRVIESGENIIRFTPDETWGGFGKIVVYARQKDGQVKEASQPLFFRKTKNDIDLSLTLPPVIVGGSTLSIPLSAQTLRREPTIQVSGTFVLEGKGWPESSGVIIPSQTLDAQGRGVLTVEVPKARGAARLFLRAWNDREFVRKEMKVSVEPPLNVDAAMPLVLTEDDRTRFSLSLRNVTAPEGTYAYVLSAPKGVRLSGKDKGSKSLVRRKTNALVFDVAAEKPTRGNIVLELRGPKDFYKKTAWPISVMGKEHEFNNFEKQVIKPGQMATIELTSKKGPDLPLSLASPISLPNVLGIWERLIRMEPFTTQEMAFWLDAAKAWNEDVHAWTAIGPESYQALRADRIRQLEMRQNSDGGFPRWPSGISDLASTSWAAFALREEAPLLAEGAIRWIQKRLENTWFEEEERAARATAFLVLTTIGRNEISGLRYFADTSRDKDLSPLAVAEIALSLALGNDDKMARAWLGRAQEELSKMIEKGDPDCWMLMQRLVENKLLDHSQIMTSYDRAIIEISPVTYVQSAAMLKTAKTLLEGVGRWEIEVRKNKEESRGVFILPQPRKNEPAVIGNATDKNIYIFRMGGEDEKKGKNANKNKEPSLVIDRQLYKMGGEVVKPDEALSTRETYLLVIAGSFKKNGFHKDVPIVVTQPNSSGFIAESVAQTGGDILGGLWPWLPMPLASVESVSVSAEGATDAFLPSLQWRTIKLITAERPGFFVLPPVTVRDITGKEIPARQNTLRWRVL